MAIDLIVTNLLADSGVAALIGDRVFFKHAPDGAGYPLCNLFPVTDTPINTLQGEVANVQRMRVQVDIWATTFASAKDASDAVKVALENEPSAFRSLRLNTRYDDDDDLGLVRISHDFAIRTS